MRYRLLICLMATVGVTNAVAVAGDGFALKGKPKVAMLYFKAKNDGGFTQSADEAHSHGEGPRVADRVC
jgi:basic membrane protein A